MVVPTTSLVAGIVVSAGVTPLVVAAKVAATFVVNTIEELFELVVALTTAFDATVVARFPETVVTIAPTVFTNGRLVTLCFVDVETLTGNLAETLTEKHVY